MLLRFVLEQQNKVRFMRLDSGGKPDGEADISGCGGDCNGFEVFGRGSGQKTVGRLRRVSRFARAGRQKSQAFARKSRDGYKNKIYANQATIELTTLSLKDSGHLQEEDAERAKRNAKRSNAADIRPLYTTADVEPMLKQLAPMPRSGGFDISPEFHLESFDAGHILGSCSFQLTIREVGKSTTVVFSGDVGRYNQPILNDPTTPP